MQESRIDSARAQENFPVASKLLPPQWRRPILDFYAFIRGMDEIADDPALKREEKRDQLRVIRLALQEDQPEMLPKWALPYYERMQAGTWSKTYGDTLWEAFWQDTEKLRYRNFDEVLAYCQKSAVPVGRAVLEITKEPQPKLAAADALCTALQLLDHLQDVRGDYQRLGRIYLPQDWMAAEGLGEKVLEKAETGPKLHKLFAQWLDEVDKLLRQAGNLPRSIRHRGLRWELRIILALARGLSRKLRHSDPMARRVRLSNLHKSLLTLGAVIGVC